MIQTRAERETLEADMLAPYASLSAKSHGRACPEQHGSPRTAFQRDRDRIVNSKSFRRLEYKTQVFVNGTADHYRTRLTHTLEVDSVGRTLARALRVNEDLTAAISLAHDIGHSPFGHCGERALNELMAGHGGFDHNVQSCRWVEVLEEEFPDFNGLNLTWEVRAGLRKHVSREPGAELDGRAIGPHQSVEAQIADVADDITYQAHDVQDGLEAGLLTADGLEDLELWQRALDRVRSEFPKCPPKRLVPTAVRKLFTLQIEDVLERAAKQLAVSSLDSPEAVMAHPERIVDFSPSMREMLQPFRKVLFDQMYFHPAVESANEEAVEKMRLLFNHYLDHPMHMGTKALGRMKESGPMRTVCDYVSGFTDRYAIEECSRHGLS